MVFISKGKFEGIPDEKGLKYEKSCGAVVCFLGMSKDGAVKIQPEEVGDYKWTNYNDAMNLLTYDSSKRLLESVKEYLITQLS